MKQPTSVDTVTIKGTSEGLVITLGAGPLHEVLAEMEARLRAKASFFRGGRVALHVGDRPLSVEQLREIGGLLEALGMGLWAVSSDHPTTVVAVREMGLESIVPVQAPAGAPPAPGPLSREEIPGLVLRRTLRSGQAVRHAGHVVLIGDVNPGAEVVAGGDIIIWGKLRGTAHAGAAGDEDAVICALQLAPSQIRIASLIARSPERGRAPKAAEMASVQNGRIVVERWDKVDRSGT
ncbi:MAG TPA: septum site-determining protein MinC [Anaerolineae bacterium]|nr:septum site-determining protein MinC [Anaerolineae bacterium]